MTNEQREAIKICEHYKNILYACNYEEGEERTGKAIDTVLSLIKEQEKQINLMAEYISKQDVEEDVCMKNKTNPDWCNEDYTNCKNCIKQYFERKVEE